MAQHAVRLAWMRTLIEVHGADRVVALMPDVRFGRADLPLLQLRDPRNRGQARRFAIARRMQQRIVSRKLRLARRRHDAARVDVALLKPLGLILRTDLDTL